ncbi:G-D-S-L family lipolytic protein [Alginatibacterium sediminis]|uniref:G-D-S-L family lipolytic protein n=1 Tax=Alginatibacterium sediminis TaxID=2164068 RepID=A0A420EAR4_9ALTE|nr:SGNH/GDSL hydrolase family protein [Alginatibacterium sediminis]RKF17760.1 G-D-S-L family lipolytic protein [Alginatibacterium sediminis]
MKKILCFGDSNTWGCSPDLPRRYNEHERWTMLLQTRLRSNYRIIEEGQNSRTTVLDDPYEPGKNGLDYLLPCLESHHPDLVVILLGTNDLKSRFNLTASDISKGAARLVKVVQGFKHDFMPKPAKVLLVSPALVLEIDPLKEGFEQAEQKSKQLAHFYGLRAKELGCHFLNAADFIKPCEREGIHWQVDQHVKFADKLAELIPEILA